MKNIISHGNLYPSYFFYKLTKNENQMQLYIFQEGVNVIQNMNVVPLYVFISFIWF